MSQDLPENPVQPFVLQGKVVRFKANEIVRYLLDHGGIDLDKLAVLPFSQDDRCQLAQLIGYSLTGYHELSYVSDVHAKDASEKARQTFPEIEGLGGCRDQDCDIHCGVEKEKGPTS